MTKSMSATIASVFVACLFAPVAIAQSPTQQNAWVSGLGKDVSTCGPETTPCRTFQFAHDHIVLAGGQIRVKDPADYSALTINKSISIINDGVGVAGISVPSGDAISINAVDDDSIFIKGLSLDGAGKGSSGISVNSAGSVTVTSSTFTGFGAFGGAGISITQLGANSISISDSFFTSNNYGISMISTPSVAFNVNIDHVTATNNRVGIYSNSDKAISILTSNRLYQNDVGIYIDKENYMLLINNIISTNHSRDIDASSNNTFVDTVNNNYISSYNPSAITFSLQFLR
jgi:parallel beta-helix repeat protein